MAPPNVLYIVCHDLGRCLGAYGRRPIRSPNLDRLAAEGIRFTNHFCTAPYCSPSRGCISTGRYPHANGLEGLVNLGWELPATETTTQEHLRAAGYETWLFGGQHERSDPHALGYDHVDVKAPREDYPRRIAECLAAAPREPFYLNYFIPEPHRPFLKAQRQPGRIYGLPNYDEVDDPGDAVWVQPHLPDHPIVRKEMGGFQRLVEAMDDRVGQVLDALDRSGLAERTLVVFTTDHGIDMPRAKGTLYDPGIETAMIMRWPGTIQPGAVSHDLLSHVDLLPTLLEIAGVPPPGSLQGRSYLPILQGRPYTPRQEIFAELGDIDPMRAIRTRTHKLIFNVRSHKTQSPPSAEIMDLVATVPDWLTRRRPLAELYDLVHDPLEMQNLWKDPACADIQADLKARLIAWMTDTGDPLLSGTLRVPNLVATL